MKIKEKKKEEKRKERKETQPVMRTNDIAQNEVILDGVRVLALPRGISSLSPSFSSSRLRKYDTYMSMYLELEGLGELLHALA